MKLNMFKKRQGSLLQTLLLCIIMATLSVFILKWLLFRFQQSVRLSNSVATKTRTEGVFNNMMSVWNFNLPANGSYSMAVSEPSGKSVNVDVNVSNNVITLTAEED